MQSATTDVLISAEELSDSCEWMPTITTTFMFTKILRRLIVENNETRAWQAWKMTCGTVLVIALVLTVMHLVVGG